MAHTRIKDSYHNLTERLNRTPQGAPPSELLHRILTLLMSEKEAELISLIPIKPFNAEKASKIWKMSLREARKILDLLSGRAILVDIQQKGETLYVLPPPMAGFFEFSLMRVRTDIDQKVLAELFYQYLNVEEDFIRDLFTRGETQLGRVFVNEPSLEMENTLHVLSWERATDVIETASHIGISTCYCRHKMMHINKACDAPMEICMTFNTTASSLIRHGHARQVDASECKDLLATAYDHMLVQFGENVRQRVNFICNCCGCCCEAMIAARRFAIMNPVQTTAFIPVVKRSSCTGCGKCIMVCPVEAMTAVSANDPRKPKRKLARLIDETCLGCGLCQRACPENSITLKRRKKVLLTPKDGVHRTVLMALERGKLQHLIFDNQVLFSHRALAAVLGSILKLSPVKKILANRQLKSRYLEALLSRY